MRHLTETELIDLLMEETPRPELADHLDGCRDCRARFSVLQDGLKAARMVEPRVPLMSLPVITHDRLQRQSRMRRFTWLAAAAVLLIGLIGIRVEIAQSRVTFEFALFKRATGQDETRIQALEQQLALTMEAVQVQSALTQHQMDARFNAFFLERDRDLQDISLLLDQKFRDTELKNQKHLVNFNDQLMESLRKQDLKGTLK